MAAEKNVTIAIVGEDRASEAFKKAADAASKFGGSVDKAKNPLASFGKIAAGVFTGNVLSEGVEKAFDFVKEGVKDAADFEQGFSGIQTAMKNAKIPDDVIEAQEKYVTNLSNTVGVSKEQLLPAYQKAFIATGKVTESQKLLNTSMDLAKAAHIPLNTAVKTLTSAYGGATQSLKKYGIEIKSGSTGSQVLADVQKKVGGAAIAATKTAAGQYQKLQTNLANMREELGEKLLPVITQFAGKIEQMLPAAEKFATGFINGFGKAIGFVQQNASWLVPVAAGIGGMVAAFKAWTTATEVWKTVQEAATAQQLAFDAAADANPIGLLVVAIAGLVAGLVVFFTKTKLGKQIWSDFTSFLGKSVTNIKAFFTDALPAAFLVFKSHAESALGTVLTAAGKLMNGFSGMLAVLGKVPGFGWATNAATAVKHAADNVSSLGSKLSTTANKDMTSAKQKADAFVKSVGAIPASKSTRVAADTASAASKLASTKSKLDAIKSKTVKVSVSAPKSVTIPLRTDTIQVTTSEGKGVMTIGSRMIALAKGGIVNKPTFALIGEDGPEAVVPLTAKNAPAVAPATPPVNVYVTNKTDVKLDDLVEIKVEQFGRKWALDLSGGVAR